MAKIARAEAERALLIDPELGRAHTTLAVTLYSQGRDWDAAERAFLRAIELSPGDATVHHWYAIYLVARGENEKALAEIRRARALDPLSLVINAEVMACDLKIGIGSIVPHIMAGFGELSVPITEDLQMQLAARYEDYGGATGSTFNPKVAVRWQATPWMALRGSAGSTFRGPPDPQLVTSSVTSLQSILGVFRAVDIYGNPNLQPEEADTYTAGVVVRRPRRPSGDQLGTAA